MSDKLSYFSYFLVSIIIIAALAKLLNLAINATETSTPTEQREIVVLDAYHYGTCNSDSDCFAAGCSTHVCSSDPDYITSCEIRDDFPDKDVYRCGCVQNSCLWYEK